MPARSRMRLENLVAERIIVDSGAILSAYVCSYSNLVSFSVKFIV